MFKFIKKNQEEQEKTRSFMSDLWQSNWGLAAVIIGFVGMMTIIFKAGITTVRGNAAGILVFLLVTGFMCMDPIIAFTAKKEMTGRERIAAITGMTSFCLLGIGIIIFIKILSACAEYPRLQPGDG